MIVILLGAPGSGKGTQSRILSAKYGFKHLATGDIFRSEIAAKTTLGLKAAEYVKSGKLVPDDTVTEMVAGKLEGAEKCLLDGFPRNLAQAHALAPLLSRQGEAIDLVIFMNLPKKEALKRLTSRRVCGSCGEVFNFISRPPKTEGKCDQCGGNLTQREDDTEATADKRLMVFEDLTRPLVVYYKAEQVFQEVDASQSLEEVTKNLCAVIDSSRALR
ncbi:MAG: adenylate kinase [Elusimicrobia bacterium RIFCSPHIGHO2_02_FULL_57_9]|nr:MAG: adenylate kinase [Elusimicrobia bacterium RIFCSPHIGHO2_02_FULL_57_9]